MNDVNNNDYNECKAKIKGKTPTRPLESPQSPIPVLKVEVSIPLKYHSNFWRCLGLSLISCEVELDLLWTKECVLTEHHNKITGVNLMIASAKLYVPVVTLSINDNIKFLENIKQ